MNKYIYEVEIGTTDRGFSSAFTVAKTTNKKKALKLAHSYYCKDWGVDEYIEVSKVPNEGVEGFTETIYRKEGKGKKRA